MFITDNLYKTKINHNDKIHMAGNLLNMQEDDTWRCSITRRSTIHPLVPICLLRPDPR